MKPLSKNSGKALSVAANALTGKVLNVLRRGEKPKSRSERTAAHNAPGQSRDQKNGAPFEGSHGRRAVLLNSDSAKLDGELINFSLRGMGFVASEVKYILNDLIDVGHEISSAKLADKIENALRRAMASDKTGFHTGLYAKYLEHKCEVLENKRSYQPKGRFNPDAVFWPDPTENGNGRSLYTELPVAKRSPFINKTTKIVSAGSCFATEIAHHLIKGGYNYLVTEDNGGPDQLYEVLGMDGLPNATAAWGIIFNTPSFRQLVEKAFGERDLPRIVWSQPHKGENLIFDPFRENVAFRSLEAFEKNYADHLAASRKAFEEMDVFIITLGLNEVWTFSADDSVFSRSPWRMAPSLVRRKVMTVQENVKDLLLMAQILRRHNPTVKIICTVSPVPLHATFRADDHHVVAANAHSKAVLRIAAEEFSKLCPYTYYFPSYEIVTVSTEKPWTADQRHVSREAVGKVMEAFTAMYVEQ